MGSTVLIIMTINYLLLIFVAFLRSRRVKKPYLIVFPIIAAVFDIILMFIPFVPTVMNIVALIVGSTSNNPVVVQVVKEEKKEEDK
jgi:hypothetical protein